MVEIDGVSKMYKLYRQPGDRLKAAIAWNRTPYHREYWALRDVTVQIQKGETFCIIGENGSGKSTLLKLIAGILEPSAGSVRVHGRLTALLELGAGFNHEFTGRQNLFLNGAILGLAPREVEACLGNILEFAEIGPYIDQPVKTYSSGMVMRLAFALAVHLHPEVLVVDEALAVGDMYFRHRCMRKIHELRARGVTIVYVTHDATEVKELGNRVLWLEHGRVRELGDVGAIVQKYLAALLTKDSEQWQNRRSPVLQQQGLPEPPPEIVTGFPGDARRHGDHRAELLGARITDIHGTPLEEVRTPAEIVVRVSLRATEMIERPIVGLLMRTVQGIDFSGTNTARQSVPVAPLLPGEIRTFDFHLRLPEIAPAGYTFSPGIAEGSLTEFQLCDLAENAISLRVLPGDRPVSGQMHFRCAVTVHETRHPILSSS